MTVKFIGTFSRTIDYKSRVTLPAAFRVSPQTKLMVTVKSDHVEFWEMEEWALLVPRDEAQRRERLLSSQMITASERWRAQIPTQMRRRVGIKVPSKVRILGAGDHIEVWPE